LLFARFSAYSLAQKKGYFFPTGINIEKLLEFVKGGGIFFYCLPLLSEPEFAELTE